MTQTVRVQALPYEDPRIREFSDMYEIRGIPLNSFAFLGD